MANALILGADGATGAYLARLLDARGVGVAGVNAGDGRALSELNVAEAVTAVAAADAVYYATDTPLLTVFAINDGGTEQAELIARVLAAGAAAFDGPRLVHVADADQVRQHPQLAEQVKQVAAWRRDDGKPAVNAVLHAHDSRLGPADTMPARLTAAAYRAAQSGGAAELIEIAETGPRDWGWTPEYVDAVIRLAAQDRLVDLAIGSGVTLDAAQFAADAFAFFKLDAGNHVRILPAAGHAPVERPVDTARLKAATGWSASTTGRDLVRALCEGAAARA